MAGARLVVLQSVPEPGTQTNPYVTQLFDALAPDVEIVPFGWRTALRGRFDVFHVHWPENLVARSPQPVRAALLLAAVLRFRRRRVAVVRTLHNLAPHEQQSRAVRTALAALDRATSLVITLNRHTPTRPGVAAVVVPHGDYLPWLARGTVPPTEPGRLVFFGLVRAYKNVGALLAAFRELAGPGLTLEVSGAARDPALAAGLTTAAALDERVDLRLGFAADDDLRRSLGRAELVVLPYREMHNSGALLLALSAARPVLVPRTPVTDDLAAEVGADWVQRYDGDLTPGALTAALDAVRRIAPGTAPDLAARHWEAVARAHVEAYAVAVAAVRAG